ncbi:TetR/AcrR family transcriptional regulator C-terminal domain-containing protein [Streptomyces sp. NPDC059999]|uniref:TetR/AcrR family transcriptional regulator C-terminal domain-containing protein n=1 Tax=Streptomyces sp. NPDC059999 TaxID=3347030 RepID=UPI0036A59770
MIVTAHPVSCERGRRHPLRGVRGHQVCPQRQHCTQQKESQYGSRGERLPLGGIALPSADEQEWREAITEYADSFRATALRHRWMCTVLGQKPTPSKRRTRWGSQTVNSIRASKWCSTDWLPGCHGSSTAGRHAELFEPEQSGLSAPK